MSFSSSTSSVSSSNSSTRSSLDMQLVHPSCQRGCLGRLVKKMQKNKLGKEIIEIFNYVILPRFLPHMMNLSQLNRRLGGGSVSRRNGNFNFQEIDFSTVRSSESSHSSCISEDISVESSPIRSSNSTSSSSSDSDEEIQVKGLYINKPKGKDFIKIKLNFLKSITEYFNGWYDSEAQRDEVQAKLDTPYDESSHVGYDQNKRLLILNKFQEKRISSQTRQYFRDYFQQKGPILKIGILGQVVEIAHFYQIDQLLEDCDAWILDNFNTLVERTDFFTIWDICSFYDLKKSISHVYSLKDQAKTSFAYWLQQDGTHYFKYRKDKKYESLKSLGKYLLEVVIDFNNISKSDLQFLFINCYNIRTLYCFNATREKIASIFHLTSLENLTLVGCEPLSDNSIIEMSSHLTNLKYLSLPLCSWLTEDIISTMRENLTQLEELDIPGSDQN